MWVCLECYDSDTIRLNHTIFNKSFVAYCHAYFPNNCFVVVTISFAVTEMKKKKAATMQSRSFGMESYGKYSGRNEWNGIYYPVFVFLVSAHARNAYEGSIKTLVSRQLNKKKKTRLHHRYKCHKCYKCRLETRTHTHTTLEQKHTDKNIDWQSLQSIVWLL